MARAARSAPPYVLAMLQTGAVAAWRSAVVEDMECMFQLLSPKLDALGSPRETPARWEEFVKSWPRKWQTLVAPFAEKRKGLKDNVAPADITGSSGDEFVLPRLWRRVSDSQATEVPSWQNAQGTEASGSVRA